MGLFGNKATFSKFFAKLKQQSGSGNSATTETEPPRQETEQAPPVQPKTEAKKRSSWIDELNDPNSGVHAALAKLASAPEKKEQEGNKNENGFEIEINANGFEGYVYIEKNGKEYFDGNVVAKYENYYIAEGLRNGNETLVLFTPKDILAIRKFDDTVEDAVVLPSGVGIVFTDEDKVITISESGNSTKSFAYGSAAYNERILTDDMCAYVEDCGEFVLLKCYILSSQTVWSKRIKYIFDDDGVLNSSDPTLRLTNEKLEVTISDGSVYRFSLGGDRL